MRTTAISKTGLLCAAALYLFAFSAPTTAAPLVCPDEPGRNVTLDADAFGGVTLTCGPVGDTNGVPGPEGDYFKNTLGLTELEKINDEDGITSGTYISLITGLGGSSGVISLVDGISDAVLVFKFGSGGVSPDWISFNLTGTTFDFTSLGWSVDPTQALSHVTLYGTFTEVPEPATLALLGLGLMGLGYRARRRQTA